MRFTTTEKLSTFHAMKHDAEMTVLHWRGRLFATKGNPRMRVMHAEAKHELRKAIIARHALRCVAGAVPQGTAEIPGNLLSDE